MAMLHPDQYVYYNAFVGGVPGAENRFKLDYWANSFAEAVRGLENRLRAQYGAGFANHKFTVAVAGAGRFGAVLLPAEFPLGDLSEGCRFRDRLYAARCRSHHDRPTHRARSAEWGRCCRWWSTIARRWPSSAAAQARRSSEPRCTATTRAAFPDARNSRSPHAFLPSRQRADEPWEHGPGTSGVRKAALRPKTGCGGSPRSTPTADALPAGDADLAGAGKLLDAGCGTGGFLASLAGAEPERKRSGSTLTRPRAAGPREKSARPVCAGSVNALPFADAAFRDDRQRRRAVPSRGGRGAGARSNFIAASPPAVFSSSTSPPIAG